VQHLHALVERRQHHLDRERREGEDEVLGADRGAVGELLVLVREGLHERREERDRVRLEAVAQRDAQLAHRERRALARVRGRLRLGRERLRQLGDDAVLDERRLAQGAGGRGDGRGRRTARHVVVGTGHLLERAVEHRERLLAGLDRARLDGRLENGGSRPRGGAGDLVRIAAEELAAPLNDAQHRLLGEAGRQLAEELEDGGEDALGVVLLGRRLVEHGLQRGAQRVGPLRADRGLGDGGRRLQRDIADGSVITDQEGTHDHALVDLVEQVGEQRLGGVGSHLDGC